MATIYRAASPDSLIVVPVDLLTAIYHRASGQTHLMASPAPEILEIMRPESLRRGINPPRRPCCAPMVAVVLDNNDG